MSQYQLQVTAQFRPELMERVLRMIRHRGFRVDEMQMSTSTDGQQLVMDMTVSSIRPITQLSRQLDKLLDVQQVEVQAVAQELKKIA